MVWYVCMECSCNLLRKDDHTGMSTYVSKKNKLFFFKIKGNLLIILGITCPLLTCYLSVTIPDPFLDERIVGLSKKRNSFCLTDRTDASMVHLRHWILPRWKQCLRKAIFRDVGPSSLVGIYESLDVGNSIFIRNDDVLSWWKMLSFETWSISCITRLHSS